MDLGHLENKLNIDKIKTNGIIKGLKDELSHRLWRIQQSAQEASHESFINLEKELNNITNLLDECSELALELKIYNQRL